MADEITVSGGIPLPSAMRYNADSRRKYPFHDLNVGDMFFLPHKTRNTIATRASQLGKSLGRTFRTRLIYMKKTNESWRVAAPNDPEAVLGVGVWRTE